MMVQDHVQPLPLEADGDRLQHSAKRADAPLNREVLVGEGTARSSAEPPLDDNLLDRKTRRIPSSALRSSRFSTSSRFFSVGFPCPSFPGAPKPPEAGC
jgi:hypothetical protein